MLTHFSAHFLSANTCDGPIHFKPRLSTVDVAQPLRLTPIVSKKVLLISAYDMSIVAKKQLVIRDKSPNWKKWIHNLKTQVFAMWRYIFRDELCLIPTWVKKTIKYGFKAIKSNISNDYQTISHRAESTLPSPLQTSIQMRFIAKTVAAIPAYSDSAHDVIETLIESSTSCAHTSAHRRNESIPAMPFVRNESSANNHNFRPFKSISYVKTFKRENGVRSHACAFHRPSFWICQCMLCRTSASIRAHPCLMAKLS